LVFCAGLIAQTSEPVFEAASIKPSPPLDSSQGPIYFGPKGGPGTDNPRRYQCTFCNVSELLSQAYDVPEYRLLSTNRLPADRFHIVATIPPETTKGQFRQMLQNLLAERFKISVHRESREMQMFRLVVGSGGPKLKVHVEGDPVVVEDRSKIKNRAPGIYYKVQGKTFGDCLKVVEAQLRHPVTDATGLTGTYDFDLWWTSDDMNTDSFATPETPTLRSAIQSIGLRLESRKGLVEVVVVDHVEKVPTGN